MHSLTVILVSFCVIYATVHGIDLEGEDLTKDEIIALTRDHFGRRNPDALLNGFFPVWATIQFLIACLFLIIAIVSTLGYFLGWRTPVDVRAKQLN